MLDSKPIEIPKRTTTLSNKDILLGKHIPPEKQLWTYSADEWELFILEWAVGLESKYQAVRRYSGKGDKGRDVMGFYGVPGTGCEWDNYQCKHYKDPLGASVALTEIAKICFYGFSGDYPLPKASYFVSPHDITPALGDLLLNPNKLRIKLLNDWDKTCKTSIRKEPTPLSQELRSYIQEIDFSRFKDLPIAELIKQHAGTRYHAARFGVMGKIRDPLPPPPESPGGHETRYVRQLLDVYGEKTDSADLTPEALEKYPDLLQHFHRQRTSFYSAEQLRVFSRETMPDDQVFGELQDEVYNAVVDTCNLSHPSSYHRLTNTLVAAQALVVDTHALGAYVGPTDKRGICHQLANEDRLTWLKK
jgi:C-terminal domain 6 of the ABC-three component (ABC-3C) systems